MSKTMKMLVLSLVLLATPINTYTMPAQNIKTMTYTLSAEGKPITQLPTICIEGKQYAPLSMMAEFIGYHTEVDKNDAHIINLVYGNSENNEKLEKMMSELSKNVARKVQASLDHAYIEGEKIDIDLIKVDGYNFIEVEKVADYVYYYLLVDETQKVLNFTADKMNTYTEEKQALYSNYLKEHAIDIDIKGENKDLLTKTGLDKYPIILVGERHGIVKTYDIELYLIKYLNKNAGVRQIFLEEGYCDAQLVNRYLRTGDESILKVLMNNLKGTYAFSKQNSDFYKALYTYNRSLPEDKKLEVIGVDIQHQTDTGVYYLISLLPEKQVPEEIKDKIERLKLSQKNGSYQYEEFIALEKDVEEKKATYMAYLGAEYEHFKLGLKGINQCLTCKQETSENGFMAKRETMMMENFSLQYNKAVNGKCIGFFGGAHTYLDAEPDLRNMGTYLNLDNKETKGKIASISLEYFKCKNMEKYGNGTEDIYYGKLQEMMAEASKGDFAIFPLCEEGSIFVQDELAASQQYLLVIKESPAATPYDQ